MEREQYLKEREDMKANLKAYNSIIARVDKQMEALDRLLEWAYNHRQKARAKLRELEDQCHTWGWHDLL